jgi:MFS family permease
MLHQTSVCYSGWVVSTSLAGATVGSFTGGSLADKFGRTRTFILDAVPLALGAFLRYV